MQEWSGRRLRIVGGRAAEGACGGRGRGRGGGDGRRLSLRWVGAVSKFRELPSTRGGEEAVRLWTRPFRFVRPTTNVEPTCQSQTSPLEALSGPAKVE